MTNKSESKPVLFSSERQNPFMRRVVVRNYKSIGQCCVEMGSLTVLVGRNGAGKSNFLDALRFVAEALQTSLDQAIKTRGGIDAVRRRSTGHPRNFAIRLEWDLPNFLRANYEFEIAARPQGAFIVRHERLRIRNASQEEVSHYLVSEGTVQSSNPKILPVASADRLYLVTASGLPEFRPIFDALISMGFYNLNPDSMKELQSPDAGELLHRDGSNIASVIARLSTDRKSVHIRIHEYLERIVPGIAGFDRVTLGPSETLEFRQQVKGSKHPWKFYALNMSDGTLRALGALTAVMQLADRKNPVSLVGIEEPETALHPGAAGILMDALREASSSTQVVLTTHSPDFLEQIDPATDMLQIVESREGTTYVTPPGQAPLRAITEHLYTVGELLRMDQLTLDESEVSNQDRQMALPFFEDAGDAR